jgi:hypothetical protein
MTFVAVDSGMHAAQQIPMSWVLDFLGTHGLGPTHENSPHELSTQSIS